MISKVEDIEFYGIFSTLLGIRGPLMLLFYLCYDTRLYRW